MAQARDWRGRFSSGGGGGGFAGVTPRGTTAASGVATMPKRGTALLKGKSSAQTITLSNGRTVGARVYHQGAGRNRTVTVQQLKGGRLSSTPPRGWHGSNARGAVGTIGRPGSPIGGNKNVRYVSPIHANTRSNMPLLTNNRAFGRGTSAGTNRRATKQGSAPRRGYIVTYTKNSRP